MFAPFGMGLPQQQPAPENMLERMQRALSGGLGILGGGHGSLGEEEQKAMRQQALLTLGANLMAAGGPSPQPIGLGQALGQSILATQQAGRQSGNDMLHAMLLKTKLKPKNSKLQDEYEYARSQGYTGSIDDWRRVATSQSAGAASLQEYNLYADQEKAAERTPEEFMPWLKKRSAYSVGAQFMPAEFGGARGPFSRVTGEFTPETTLPQEAAATQTIEQAKATGAKTGTLGTEREFDRPAAQARLDSASQKVDLFIKKAGDIAADPALSRATGLMSYIPSVYGGGAKNVENAIDALKAQLGFNELQEMRQSSPTGGALGQVTERELMFLQNSLLSLERSQSPEQYRSNLLDIIEYANGMRSRLKRAFEQTYTSGSGTQPRQQKRVRVDASGNVIQ